MTGQVNDPPITGSGTLWCLWFGIPVRSWVDPFKLTGGQNCGELGTPGTRMGYGTSGNISRGDHPTRSMRSKDNGVTLFVTAGGFR